MLKKKKFKYFTREVIWAGDPAVDPEKIQAFREAGCPSEYASYLLPGGEPMIFKIRSFTGPERLSFGYRLGRAYNENDHAALPLIFFDICKACLSIVDEGWTLAELAESEPLCVMELGTVISTESSIRASVKN